MAEFIGNNGSPAPDGVGTMIGPGPARCNGLQHGFAAMGHPVPMFRRQAALDHLEQMGVDNGIRRGVCVAEMAEKLERDRPYDAMATAMKYVDLTGTYRLMAVLLTGEDESYVPSAEVLQTVDVGELLQREADLRAEMKRQRRESWQAQEEAAKKVEEAERRADMMEIEAFNAKLLLDKAERRADAEIASASRQLEAEFETRVQREVDHRLHGPILDVDGAPRRRIVV